jgi:hypothetical protein
VCPTSVEPMTEKSVCSHLLHCVEGIRFVRAFLRFVLGVKPVILQPKLRA